MNTKPISPKKRFALRLIEKAKNDSELAALYPNTEVYQKAVANGSSLDKVIATFLDGYANRPLFGERRYEIVKNENGASVRKHLPEFQMITYGEFHRRVKAIAMTWRTNPDFLVERDDFVFILGFGDTDFATVDFACAYAKAVTVPAQSSTSGADLDEILATIQPVQIATTIADLEVATNLAINQPAVKSITVFNYDAQVDGERERLEAAQKKLADCGRKIAIATLQELITFGKTQPWSHLPEAEDELEKRSAIIHSSGSTGKPKGAVLNQHTIIHIWSGRESKLPRVSVLLAPLNHIMGRINIFNVVSCGGTGYFTAEPDMSTLFEDIRLASPTHLNLFPRIFELVYQHFQTEVARRLPNRPEEKSEIEQEVMLEMRSTYLGSRLLAITFGSAPTSKKVRKFMQECFDVLLMEGYGNTESGTGSITVEGKIYRENVTDYKLRDVPELGYFVTDKPFPRGELLVKTKYGITEYYKKPEVTADLFDEEGYSCTGDIVVETAPDEVAVIDRRKDVLKLSHGEYVATGTLGTVFEAGSALIKQIYVYGSSQRSYLLAVVFPELEVLKQHLGESYSENQAKNLIRFELNQVASKEDIKKFEVPRDYIIADEEFTQANGLLSSVRKRLRPALKRKYGQALEDLYDAHENATDERVAALKDPNSKLSTVEKLVILLESQLGVEGIESDKPHNFGQLGGDSLGAALYAFSIEETFGINIGADQILSPTGNLKLWAQYIDEAKDESIPDQASFASVHGKDVNKVHVNQMKLDKFLDQGFLDAVHDLPYAPLEPNTVLLTGANGFLGHIVCLEWLKELSPKGGKLICLIRENDDVAAFEKLAREFKGSDPKLEADFNALAKNSLEVLAADIGRPHLGLSPEVFTRLSKEVDRVCHVAALVNHRLSYQNLFGPNVVGTAEVIRLALSHKKKPIDFISSVGVFMLLDGADGIDESTPFKEELSLSDAYASGYAVSKWAGEILLEQVNEDFDIPVNMFRCDIIMPHQEYVGQSNKADMLSRLLYSVAVTGLAPQSFYKGDADERSIAHYKGVPVDALSQAIAGVFREEHSETKIYHAVNYLTDNVSLDSFVDWIESAGHKIDRLTDHADWYRRMETKLKALPEEQRKQSALDVLMAYGRPLRASQNQIGTDNFEELIDTLGKVLPTISEGYLHMYVKGLV